MEFHVDRETLLRPMQAVIGVVERRQTLPILGNVLLNAQTEGISLTATDLEVEIQALAKTEVTQPGDVTLPARKLMDILRNLPDSARIHVKIQDSRALLQLSHSRFTLATLPATEYPVVEETGNPQSLELAQTHLRWLIERTGFAMALQDVRFYLNGLLLELEPDCLRAVATDGHRLALAEVEVQIAVPEPKQVIVPRKAVQELLRLLSDADTSAQLQLSKNHLRVSWSDIRFTTKLIDGKFPNYQRVIPQAGGGRLQVGRNDLRLALTRASILSNERIRGVRLILDGDWLRIRSNNPDQEEAEEELSVDYDGEPVEIGFNAGYLLDALAAIEESSVEILVNDSNSSALLYGLGNTSCRYVVMPLHL